MTTRALRTFEMFRERDQTGVSGEGKVLEGVEFTDGVVVLRWATATGLPNSTVVWESFAAFWKIHVDPHSGNGTTVRFSDGTVLSHD